MYRSGENCCAVAGVIARLLTGALVSVLAMPALAQESAGSRGGDASGQVMSPAGGDTASANKKASADPALLDIWEYDIDGNSVLDEKTIDEAVEAYLGPQKSPDEIDKARAALESVYRERGFKTVSVDIPRQTVRDGVVRLEVVQGRIGHLNVVGSKYHSLDEIKDDAPSLAEGSVPNFKDVQGDIVALNQQADRKVTPVLKAGATPGTVDVDLVVDDHLPLHGTLEVNNRRSQDTSELRTSASLSYDNLWQLGHSLSLSYQTAPENQADARVFYASYLARFDTSPFSLLLSGIKSDSNVATVGSTDVLGKGQTVEMRGILSLPSTPTFYHSLSFGVAYKHFNNRISLGTDKFETPVTYYPLSLGYTSVVRAEDSVTQADFTLSFASSALGSTASSLDTNRFKANGQQFFFKENLTHTRSFGGGAQAMLRFSGQLTDQPLLTSEEFSAGGYDSVRGYLEAEVLGDYGASGTLELRTPSVADDISFGTSKPFDELRGFAFFDGAKLLLRSPQIDQRRSFAVASFGAGFNFNMFTYLYGALDWADPFYNGPATRAWSSRVLFRVWTTF